MTALATAAVMVLGVGPSVGVKPQAASTTTAPTAAEPLTTQHRSRDEVIPRLSPEAVAYYTDEYRVTRAEAQRRLADQNRFGDLSTSLRRLLGADFASAEYDNRAGEWTVAVTPDASTDDIARAVEATGVDAVSRVVTHTNTDAQLRNEADRLLPLVSGILDRPDDRFSISVDGGRLVIDVAETTSASDFEALTRLEAASAARLMRRSHGPSRAATDDPVSVRRSGPGSLPGPPAISCGMPYCDTLMGGISIWLYANDAYPIGPGNGSYCTAGFWVGYPGGPRVSLLTAGHCIHNIGQPWGTCSYGGTSCHNVGSQVTAYNGGPPSAPDGDAGLIKQDVAGFGAHPGYVNWATLGIGTIRWYETSNPALGQVVCKEGVTTGNTCGTVTASYANINGDSNGTYYVGMFRSDACSQQGDSGGPWLRGETDTAVGLTSHGNYSGQCAPFASFGEPIHRPLQRWGATLYGG